MTNEKTTYTGIGLGTLIAVIVSYGANNPLIWVIIHGILGWFYVIWKLIT